MQFPHFESSFDKDCLILGESYYLQQLVSITCTQEHHYYATVGKEQIDLSMQQDSVVAVCSCQGALQPCKHIAAALFALRAQQQGSISLKLQLEALSRAQLIHFIEQLAQHYPPVQHFIQQSMNTDDVTFIQAKDLVQRTIRNARNRYDQLPEKKIPAAFEGMYTILHNVKAYITDNNSLLATRLMLLCYETTLTVQNYEDRKQLLRPAFTACEETLALLVKQTPQQAVFDMLAHFAVHGPWRFFPNEQAAFLDCLKPLALIFPAGFIDLLEQLRDLPHIEDSEETLVLLQYELLKTTGDEARIQRFLQQQLHIPAICQVLIDQTLAEEQFERAIPLIEQALTQRDASEAQLITWRRLLYSLYEMQQQTEQLAPLALQLVLAGEQEFYTELSFLVADWPTEKERILDQLATQQSDLYKQIIVEEQLIERLLHYCQQHPTEIFTFATTLSMYPQEVIRLMRNVIFSFAHVAITKAHYEKLIGYVQAVIHAGYIEEAQIIRTELYTLYPQKKALLTALEALTV